MSTTFEESCKNYSITDEKAKKQFEAVCEFTASQPARGGNAAPGLGVEFFIPSDAVPEKLCVDEKAADKKYWVRFPVVADGDNLGISLSRLQGHYSKLKVWKNGVKDCEVAANAAQLGVKVTEENGLKKFEFIESNMLVLKNQPREAVDQLMEMRGRRFAIVATFTAGEYKTKYSLIAKL